MNFIKIWLTLVICFHTSSTIAQHTLDMNTIELKGLRTTIYKVDDLQAATDWYSRVFGVEPYFKEPFYVGFNIGGYELGLLPEKVDGPRTTNILSYWGVEDITDAFDKMVSSGAKELEIPTDVGGGIKVALVKDPWQNVIGLIHNPHFKVAIPEEAVVEWAAFRVKPNTTPDQLSESSKRLDVDFLSKQKGFISRQLLKKSEYEYVDVLYWESESLAKQAMANTENSEACAAYFSLMELPDPSDPNGVIQHFQVVPY